MPISAAPSSPATPIGSRSGASLDLPRVRLGVWRGAVIGPQSGVPDGEFLVALDVQARRNCPRRNGSPQRKHGVFASPAGSNASGSSRPRSEVVQRFDSVTGVVKVTLVERYDALILAERPTKPDPEAAAELLARRDLVAGREEGDERLLRRLRFAGLSVDLDHLARAAAVGARSLADVTLARALTFEDLRVLDRDAPDTIVVPSGRSVRLEYDSDGGV